MTPRHSGQFVLGVEAEEGVEGNLNYFDGGLECKKPTSWEHPPLRREPHVAREGAPPRPRVLLQHLPVDERILCFPAVDWGGRMALARLSPDWPMS